MEDVLDLYQAPYDPDIPMICMDEMPYQLLGDTRKPLPMKPGSYEKIDHEYERNGTYRRNICAHFGHCENFNIFDMKDGRIVAENSVPNPSHRPGFLPNFLADLHVTTILAGGMGNGAVQIFNERNVEVVVGASGDARTAIERYLKGELKTTGGSATSTRWRRTEDAIKVRKRIVWK